MTRTQEYVDTYRPTISIGKRPEKPKRNLLNMIYSPDYDVGGISTWKLLSNVMLQGVEEKRFLKVNKAYMFLMGYKGAMVEKSNPLGVYPIDTWLPTYSDVYAILLNTDECEHECSGCGGHCHGH